MMDKKEANDKYATWLQEVENTKSRLNNLHVGEIIWIEDGADIHYSFLQPVLITDICYNLNETRKSKETRKKSEKEKLKYNHFIPPNLKRLATLLGCRENLPEDFCQNVCDCLGNDNVCDCLGNDNVCDCLGNDNVCDCLGNDNVCDCLGNGRRRNSLTLIPLISLIEFDCVVNKEGSNEKETKIIMVKKDTGPTAKEEKEAAAAEKKLSHCSKEILDILAGKTTKNKIYSSAKKMMEELETMSVTFENSTSLLDRLSRPRYQAYFRQVYKLDQDTTFDNDYHFGRWIILDSNEIADKNTIFSNSFQHRRYRQSRDCNRKIAYPDPQINHKMLIFGQSYRELLKKNDFVLETSLIKLSEGVHQKFVDRPRYYCQETWLEMINVVKHRVSSVHEICLIILLLADIHVFSNDWQIRLF